MDISSLAPTREAVFVQLTDPTDDTKLLWDIKTDDDGKETGREPVGVMLYGQDSEPYEKRQRQLIDKRLAEGQQRKAKGKPKVNSDEVEREALATVAACIAGWKNIADENGPLDQQDTIAVLKRYPWIRDQVDEAIMDRSNFIKTS